MPGDDVAALSAKLAEVKANFPDVDTIRVSAEPELPFSELVKALDAAVMRDKRMLFPNVIVGRFEFATYKGPQIGDLGTKGGAGYGTGDPAP